VYDIDIHSHVSPCLPFNIAWTGLFHHLLIPKQNCTVLVSWLFFFPLSSLIVGSICWLSRVLPIQLMISHPTLGTCGYYCHVPFDKRHNEGEEQERSRRTS
jgi:hypothetical protein